MCVCGLRDVLLVIASGSFSNPPMVVLPGGVSPRGGQHPAGLRALGGSRAGQPHGRGQGGLHRLYSGR